jgi:hypothetical protein
MSDLLILSGKFNLSTIGSPGIGAGPGSTGISRVDNIVIRDGQFDIAAGQGSAIGTFSGGDGVSVVTNLTIQKGTYMIKGETGIGASGQGKTDLLSFAGDDGDPILIDCKSERIFCFSATQLVATGVSVQATTNTRTFIKAGWNVSDLAALDFIGRHIGPSEKDHFGTVPILHFGGIHGIEPARYELAFSDAESGLVRTVPVDLSLITGLTASLAKTGRYRVTVTSQEGLELGQLCDGNRNLFDVGYGETFVANASVCPEPGSSPGSSTTVFETVFTTVAVILLVSSASVGICCASRSFGCGEKRPHGTMSIDMSVTNTYTSGEG